MVKSIRAPELKDALPLPTPSERPSAGERGLTEPLRAVLELVADFGYRPGGSHREKDTDYGRVLAVDIGDSERLIVCKDEIQVIHQRYVGEEWRSLSFHCTLNRRLQGTLQNARSAPEDTSSMSPPTEQPEAAQRGATEALNMYEAPALGSADVEAQEIKRDD